MDDKSRGPLNAADWAAFLANQKAGISSPPPPTGDDRPKPRFRTVKQFCAEYAPLAEVVDGVLVSGSLYTLTATTGTGKTALIITTALAGAAGRDFLGRRVKQGRYAICTAENPDGVRMRLAVGCFHWNIDQDAVGSNLLISDNRVRPEEICEYLTREAEHGPFTGIFIDTWQAFFDGQNANNPTEAVNFTRRFRPLTFLPGSPVVVVSAHPNKNASNDELIPSGGGSTLNEVDGNLTLAMQPSGLIELGWQGKFRGYHFEPQLFRIEKLSSPHIVDVEGRQIFIPIMLPSSAEDAEKREAAIANQFAQGGR
jgi:AAA domain